MIIYSLTPAALSSLPLSALVKPDVTCRNWKINSSLLVHQHLYVYGSASRASWDRMNRQLCVSGAGRRTAVVSYGSSGDCGPGPVLSSTRGMRQLKESLPCRTTNRPLLAEDWGHMAARWKTCWQLGDRKMPWKQRELSCDPDKAEGWTTVCKWRKPRFWPTPRWEYV